MAMGVTTAESSTISRPEPVHTNMVVDVKRGNPRHAALAN